MPDYVFPCATRSRGPRKDRALLGSDLTTRSSAKASLATSQRLSSSQRDHRRHKGGNPRWWQRLSWPRGNAIGQLPRGTGQPGSRRRRLPGRDALRYTEATWAEDRATRGRDPSADPGAKTGVGGRTPPLRIPGIGQKAINPLKVSLILTDLRTHGIPSTWEELVTPEAHLLHAGMYIARSNEHL